MKVVKICGIKRYEAAELAAGQGADLLGMILVPGRSRTIELEEAKKISAMIKSVRKQKERRFQTIGELLNYVDTLEFESTNDMTETMGKLIQENGPFLVGVFRNQLVNDVFKLSEEIDIDIIQLHGNENKLEYCNENSRNFNRKYGIIPRFVIPGEISQIYTTLEEVLIGGKYFGNGFTLPLLDSELGGEGKLLDWSLVNDLTQGRFMLAGGLTEFNLQGLNGYNNLIGFDVSGGVETHGEKDPQKLENFIKVAKSIE